MVDTLEYTQSNNSKSPTVDSVHTDDRKLQITDVVSLDGRHISGLASLMCNSSRNYERIMICLEFIFRRT